MKRVLFLAVVLCIGGCAMKYQPLRRGSGFYDYKIQEDVFNVGYKGAGNTERAEDFTLLRSAEVTLTNGYKYFVIVKEVTAT